MIGTIPARERSGGVYGPVSLRGAELMSLRSDQLISFYAIQIFLSSHLVMRLDSGYHNRDRLNVSTRPMIRQSSLFEGAHHVRDRDQG
jgi:hypothetical protein